MNMTVKVFCDLCCWNYISTQREQILSSTFTIQDYNVLNHMVSDTSQCILCRKLSVYNICSHFKNWCPQKKRAGGSCRKRKNSSTNKPQTRLQKKTVRDSQTLKSKQIDKLSGCACLCMGVCVRSHLGQTSWVCLMKSQAGQIGLGGLVQPLWPPQILLLQPLHDSLQRKLSYFVVRALQEMLQELAHQFRASPQLRDFHAGV